MMMRRRKLKRTSIDKDDRVIQALDENTDCSISQQQVEGEEDYEYYSPSSSSSPQPQHQGLSGSHACSNSAQTNNFSILNKKERSRNTFLREGMSGCISSNKSSSPKKKIRLRCLSLPFVILVITLLMMITTLIPTLHDFIFGIHPLPGGMLGRFIDARIRSYIWHQTLNQGKQELIDWNIRLDDGASSSISTARVKTMPHAVLREIIRKKMNRKKILERIADFQQNYSSSKLKFDSTSTSTTTTTSSTEKSNSCKHAQMPRVLIRPRNLWNRPTASIILGSGSGSSSNSNSSIHLQLLDLDQDDVSEFISYNSDSQEYKGDDYPKTNKMYAKLVHGHFQQEYMFLNFLENFGGIYIHPNVNPGDSKVSNPLEGFIHAFDSDDKCKDMGVVVVERGIIQMMAFSPKHPVLSKIVHKVRDEVSDISIDDMNMSMKASMKGYGREHISSEKVTSLRQYYQCRSELETSSFESGLCLSPYYALLRAISSEDDDLLKTDSTRTIAVSTSKKDPVVNLAVPTAIQDIDDLSHSTMKSNRPSTSKYTSVTISEYFGEGKENVKTFGVKKNKYSSKISLDALMYEKSRFCVGIWMFPCHRCLRSAMHGSHAKCSHLCGSCFDDVMFQKEEAVNDNDKDDESIVLVDVKIEKSRSRDESQPKPDDAGEDHNNSLPQKISKMIPRIIHQTWFEDISPTNYPQLFRLQETWKSQSYSGWTYKFYTDEDARNYISKYFPAIFLEAYDALIPGAYKADLFRYMVLLKEGGVYADVDVMLEASIGLDAFISPSMSFFAPRDAVGEYANGQYCLWNGLLGVAPGHPIMLRAVERLVNLILKRADLLDIERDALKVSSSTLETRGVKSSTIASSTTEIWKVRAVQELVLSGPCALGLALNEALENDPVATVEVGWLDLHNTSKSGMKDDLGDIMILMADKEDLGALRFTDVERNIIFASTDMPGLTKDRLDNQNPTNSVQRVGQRQARTNQEEELKQTGNKKKPHYKMSGRGSWLWGTTGVYKDGLISEKMVRFETINFDRDTGDGA